MPARQPFTIIDLPGEVPFPDGLALQEDIHRRRRAGDAPDTLVLLEHAPVYTIGRTSDQSSLQDTRLLPHPVHEINRGGKATYHGPGQLTGYIIADLTPYGRDLHLWLRAIEDALSLACATFGVTAGPRAGLTGVWVENRKLASIGVGVRHWVTMHGFGINLTSQALSGFQSITPCGLDGVRMTTLAAEASRAVTRADFTTALLPALADVLNRLSASGTNPPSAGQSTPS